MTLDGRQGAARLRLSHMGDFKISVNPTHMFWIVEEKPEYPEKTYAITWKICKLHRDEIPALHHRNVMQMC